MEDRGFVNVDDSDDDDVVDDDDDDDEGMLRIQEEASRHNQDVVSDGEVEENNSCDNADIGLNGELMHHNKRPQRVHRRPAWARSGEYVMGWSFLKYYWTR